MMVPPAHERLEDAQDARESSCGESCDGKSHARRRVELVVPCERVRLRQRAALLERGEGAAHGTSTRSTSRRVPGRRRRARRWRRRKPSATGSSSSSPFSRVRRGGRPGAGRACESRQLRRSSNEAEPERARSCRSGGFVRRRAVRRTRCERARGQELDRGGRRPSAGAEVAAEQCLRF